MVKTSILSMANYLFLLILALLFIYPVYFIVCISFSSPEAVLVGRFRLFPVHFTADAYIKLLKYEPFLRAYYNTFMNMFLGLILNMILTMSTAYALSQSELPGRKGIICLFVVTLLFSGGILPLYLLVRNTIGVNNRLSVILPNAFSVVSLLISLVYLHHNVPATYKEIFRLEGSDDFTYFFKIVLPVSKPLIVVIAVLYMLTEANNYFFPMLFISDKKLFPLQLILRNMIMFNEKDAAVGSVTEYAMIVFSILPFAIMYPFVQHQLIYKQKRLMYRNTQGA